MVDAPGKASSATAEAADWYARLRAPDVSEIEGLRFRAWLAGDPAHRQEFDAVDALWGDLAAIENLPEVTRTREDIATRFPVRKKWRGSLALAATIVLAVTGAGMAWQYWAGGRYVTNVGEQRMVPLDDGSVVTLDTSTQIKQHYTDVVREVDCIGQEKSLPPVGGMVRLTLDGAPRIYYGLRSDIGR